MSYLLEILGRGRVSEMRQLFAGQFVPVDADQLDDLRRQADADTDTGRRNPDLLARLGVAQLQRYRVRDAIDSFKQALRVQPEFLLARLGLACCHEHLDQLEPAVEQLTLANTNLPGEPGVLLALGYCHERLGHPDTAADYYRDLLERSPQTTAARERLAAIDLAAGRHADAIEHYQWLRDTAGGGDPHVRLCLANLYLKANRAQDAVREFSAAIALAPENWAARQQLAATLADNGQVRDAIEHLLELLAEQGDLPDVHVQLGDLYARIGDDSQAVASYRNALETNRDYLEAAVKLATQHLRAGRFADAAAAFNQSVDISDRALTAYVGLAVAQKHAGQWSAACDTLELATQLAPNSTLLFREFARLELRAALARRSESVFTPGYAASTPSPGSADDEDWDQLLDFQLERHERAVQQRPSHADLHYRLGLLHSGAGDLQQAIERFRMACQINPAYTKARIKLGLALKEAGAVDDAIAELEAALDIEPQFADVHYRLGLIFVEQEKLAEAAEAFEKSLDINTNNAEVRANLATCLESMGLLDRASEQWELLAGGDAGSPFATRARRRLDHIANRRMQ